ncbi:MAG: NAD(P)-dependent oxidoreductase, partial [Clostridia bacterium]|nr:NAD(P)-dependent oxidoreductase [Clostridia bacterium]
MGKITILVNKAMQEKVFNEKYINRLGKQGDVFIYDKDDFVDSGYVIDFVKESEIIITSWGTPSLSKEILDVCPDLKAVLHAAGSVKPIISDELLKRKIRVTSSAIALGEGVAETALAFAISACKGFYSLGKDTAKGLWGENKAIVKDFYDITVGVISGGFVGRHMAKLLKNFHVDILMYDPTLSKEYIENLGAKKVELEKLLCDSDVISIHAPSIPATDNML